MNHRAQDVSLSGRLSDSAIFRKESLPQLSKYQNKPLESVRWRCLYTVYHLVKIFHQHHIKFTTAQ